MTSIDRSWLAPPAVGGIGRWVHPLARPIAKAEVSGRWRGRWTPVAGGVCRLRIRRPGVRIPPSALHENGPLRTVAGRLASSGSLRKRLLETVDEANAVAAVEQSTEAEARERQLAGALGEAVSSAMVSRCESRACPGQRHVCPGTATSCCWWVVSASTVACARSTVPPGPRSGCHDSAVWKAAFAVGPGVIEEGSHAVARRDGLEPSDPGG
jgi:hypothetical protein